MNEVSFSRGHNVAGKTTLYDMEVRSLSFMLFVSIEILYLFPKYFNFYLFYVICNQKCTI